MYSIEDKLGFIATTAKAIQADLKAIPDKIAISELLEACQAIEERFKEFCGDFDDMDDLEPGTTYKEGVPPIEFYIESGDWEEISRALRKLTKDLDNDQASL